MEVEHLQEAETGLGSSGTFTARLLLLRHLFLFITTEVEPVRTFSLDPSPKEGFLLNQERGGKAAFILRNVQSRVVQTGVVQTGVAGLQGPSSSGPVLLRARPPAASRGLPGPVSGAGQSPGPQGGSWPEGPPPGLRLRGGAE